VGDHAPISARYDCRFAGDWSGDPFVFKYKVDPLPTGSYNAELVKQLSPEMQAKMQNYGTPIRE